MNLKSINPHDQSVVGESVVSTPQEIKNTVLKAKAALQNWKNVSSDSRVGYIKKFRMLVAKKREKIAKLTTLEMGKPIQQSLDDIDGELTFIDYYIKNGPKFLSDETVLKKDKSHFKITYESYGVCACIAPWNYPLSMSVSGVIPALIAGNCVVFKPSEYTSISQKMVIDLLNETGLPKGVMSLLIGDASVGRMLVDEAVDLVWFTGSSKAGQEIYTKCGKKFIKAILELGGSSPAIVFADANLIKAIKFLFWGRFSNCGQSCNAVKRLLVEKPIYDKIVRLFIDRLKNVKVGNPFDDDTDIGPLISQKQLEILKIQFADAISKGAKVAIGGKQPTAKNLAKGNYFEPTILTNISSDMKVMSEEVFGPILPIVPFRSEEEAVRIANNTQYGLSAEVYTTNMEKAKRVARQIEAGVVAINTDNFFKPQSPFGGYKKSGMGREYGEIGMREFSQVKVIAVVKP